MLSHHVVQIFTDRETLQLVQKESACLGGHDHIPLEVPHAMMNKYRGPDDGNFKMVWSSLNSIFDRTYATNTSTLGYLSKTEVKCLQNLSTSDYERDENKK